MRAPALKAAKVDEIKLKLRLKEDDEFLIAAFGVILRFAQSSVQDLERELIAVLAAIPSIFTPEIRDLANTVKTIERYIGLPILISHSPFLSPFPLIF